MSSLAPRHSTQPPGLSVSTRITRPDLSAGTAINQVGHAVAALPARPREGPALEWARREPRFPRASEGARARRQEVPTLPGTPRIGRQPEDDATQEQRKVKDRVDTAHIVPVVTELGAGGEHHHAARQHDAEHVANEAESQSCCGVFGPPTPRQNGDDQAKEWQAE